MKTSKIKSTSDHSSSCYSQNEIPQSADSKFELGLHARPIQQRIDPLIQQSLRVESTRETVHQLIGSPRLAAQRLKIEQIFGAAKEQQWTGNAEPRGQVATGPSQRKRKDDDEPRQRKPWSQPPTQMMESSANRTGLPDQLKSGIEKLSGIDLSDVRVHYNSTKPGRLNALAYTQGSSIHVAPGQTRHLPHEAWHVVQQKQHRVQPTMSLKGTTINDDSGLEKEADIMGAKASQARKAN